MRARPKIDKMWRVWYTILVLLLHTFLLYSAFQRYDSFRRKALRESWPMAPMNFYLAVMICACFLLPVFAYAAFVRTGNYADDGVQVGRDRENLKVAITETQPAAAGFWPRLRRHFLPCTCVLHILMAYCLTVPLPVLEAAEIRNERLAKSSVWRSNLDFLLRPTASATSSVSTEVFNLMLALCILLVRYPSVFWFTNRLFAFLFSVLLCACGLQAVLSQEASAILLKAADVGGYGTNLPPAAVVVLQWLSDLLLLAANVAFFEFGYAQMLSSLRKYKHYLQLEDGGGSERSCSSGSGEEAACWLHYAPHLLGVLLMVLGVVLKAPLLWDWVALHRSEQHELQQQRQPVLMAALVSAVVYLSLWIAAWLLLGFKSNWKFNVRLEVEIPNKLTSFHDNQALISTPEHQRANSDAGKKQNHYVFVQRDGVSMIPTISEQVEQCSESAYGTVDRSGLVKYQVRRNSTQSLAQGSSVGSLRRSSSQSRRVGNRVTFKDAGGHQGPGSPGSSQNTSSSDSGIDSARQATVQADDYARVGKLRHHQQQQQQQQLQQLQQQQRPASRQSNYDEYQMFGGLFHEDQDYYTRHELQQLQQQRQQQQQQQPTYASHCDIYGHGQTFVAEEEEEEMPDILLSRSPYSSLGRQHKTQVTGGYSPLPPPPPEMDDRVDALCSQV